MAAYLEQNIEVVKVKNLSTDKAKFSNKIFPMLDEVSPKEHSFIVLKAWDKETR